ncbi:RNA polymerase sigma factor [Piscibacillus halophilus]|uniref:RNA polymerase sigma factor n=1 Tax=Piscibacillus halophilus TaxID=571933 RepID=A0A1H9EZS4_9BACI|nr:RNA polymerase sigma factor [Piscibacillus halophilus]SEQ30498.1 RNA polymerase sigma-70 factor, ECF subfamily [Piscibacillus halophilus]
MDEELITEWFDRYADDIYRFLAYYTSSPDVEDLVQEVFIKAIDRFDSFKGNSSPKTWLFTIARNLAIDEARKRKRQDWRKLINTYQSENEQSPEELYQLTESKSQLYEAIHKLKPTYRDVIILRGIEELSIAEAADVLKWSENKVRVTFYRALKALKLKVGRVSYD